MKAPQHTAKLFAGFMTALWVGFYLLTTTTEEPPLCSKQTDPESCVNASRPVSSCAWVQKKESCVPFDPCSAYYYPFDDWPKGPLLGSKPINGTFLTNASCARQVQWRSYIFMILWAGMSYWIHHMLWTRSFIVARESFAETAGWLFLFTYMLSWIFAIFLWKFTSSSVWLCIHLGPTVWIHMYTEPNKPDNIEAFRREHMQEQGSIPL